MDARVQKLLNDFSKSQPALNLPGVPAAEAAIQLGDLIASGSNPVAAVVAALSPATSADLTGADSVDQSTLESEISLLKGKINAILSALKAAGLMSV